MRRKRTAAVAFCSYLLLVVTCSDQPQPTRCVTDLDCPGGQRCIAGECRVFDPCEGVVCDQPPPPVCLDASTRRQYLADGQCVLGKCAYPKHDFECPHGCQDGFCLGYPCLGVICDRPPQAICVDDQTRRFFLSPGTCEQGECAYTSQDETCPYGCAAGECQPCTPQWTDAGACQCTPTACSGCQGQKLQQDGCGNERTVSCSREATGCPAGEFCYQNACCRPDCSGRECGADGCGGSCGVCPNRFSCNGWGRCELTSPCPRAPLPAAGSFGFDYAVPYHVGAWYSTEWPASQGAFNTDVKTMTALGGRVVRLMLLPYYAGMKLEEGRGNVGDPAALAAAVQNLPEIIRRLQAEGLAVILALGPNALYWNGPDQRRWWEWAYGADGWSRFTDDVAKWSRQLVMAIESSSACSGVLYWDLLNEADYRIPGMSELVRKLAARVPLQQEKLGLSALLQTDIQPMLADLRSQGREPAFLDIHSYPDRGVNSQPSSALQALRSAAPGAQVLLGEYAGIFCENGRDEDRQRDTELQVAADALAGGALAVLRWMLWDYADGDCSAGDTERTGLGFSPSRPRDNFGRLAQAVSRLADADFELGEHGWFPGGTDGLHQMWLGGPDEGDAATNLHYLRLTITGSGTYWICSPAFAASGRLDIDGYVRSNSDGVTLDVHYRDTAGWNHDTGRPPLQITIPLSGQWRFHNIQQQAGGVSFSLPGGTSEALICFARSGNGSGPVYVDIDAVAVSLR